MDIADFFDPQQVEEAVAGVMTELEEWLAEVR